jgi:hypothetical protein
MPSKASRKNSWASVILIVVLATALLVVKTCRRSVVNGGPTSGTTTKTSETGRGLNRNPANINYSKHARCRMACRHISEAEVRDILKTGKVNYTKSDLDAAECKKRYAVEGVTTDGQKVRMVFAPCQSEVTVVTVIDIGKEWACDCP